MHRVAARGLLVAAAALAPAVLTFTQAREPWPGMLDEHPAIAYATAPTTDPVGQLGEALASGAQILARDPRTGYLPALLDALDISAESQLLVFSRTGVQRAYTSPRSPRALYFNSSVIVGYIAGAPVIEIASHDARQGVIFYMLPQTADRPVVRRQLGCLVCHVSSSTLDVPGVLARSHRVDDRGELMPDGGSIDVDHRTPHPDRWGGWFVTTEDGEAKYGQRAHAGNLTYPSPGVTSTESFVAWIGAAPDARAYLSGSSDIVSLLVFDHQMHAMNLLTRLGWASRIAAGDRPKADGDEVSRLVNELAAYLTFEGEAPPLARLTPRPEFARHLEASVPRDRQGRSLAAIDAGERLFRYPCSYMIYSPAFDALQPSIKQAVYTQLIERLRSRPGGAHALEILRSTKADVPR